MKFLSLTFLLMLFACTSESRNTAGADRQRAYEEQREEERIETLRDPIMRPGSESRLPY